MNRARVGVLGLVLALAGSPVLAAVDTGTSKFVDAGRNIGEFQGWREIYFHAATGSIGYGTTRTHDAQGIAITSELGNNTQSYSASGTVTPCIQHATSSLRFTSKAELGGPSSVDFEAELLRTGCLPGRYTVTVSKGADLLSMSREYLSDYPYAPVTLTFASSAHVPAVGCTITTVQPYASTIGTTNASGQVTANLSPGWYRVQLTDGGVNWRTFAFYYFYVGSIPTQGNVAKSFVATPLADPAPTSTGNLRVTVADSQDGSPIMGAQVQVGGGVFYTGGDGAVWVTDMAAGTWTVSASKTGYQTQTTTKSVTAGNLAVQAFVLIPTGSPGTGGGGDGTGGGWDPTELLNPDFWTGMLTAAFVPGPDAFDQWETLRTDIATWGPFGVVAAFWDDFSTPGTIAGENGLFFEFDVGFGSGGSWNSGLDLRPALAAEEADYIAHPESRGSFMGTFIAQVRPLTGLLTWALFFIWLFKSVLPRLQW